MRCLEHFHVFFVFCSETERRPVNAQHLCLCRETTNLSSFERNRVRLFAPDRGDFCLGRRFSMTRSTSIAQESPQDKTTRTEGPCTLVLVPGHTRLPFSFLCSCPERDVCLSGRPAGRHGMQCSMASPEEACLNCVSVSTAACSIGLEFGLSWKEDRQKQGAAIPGVASHQVRSSDAGRVGQEYEFAVKDRIVNDFGYSPSRFSFGFVNKPYRVTDEVRTLSQKRRMLTIACSVVFLMLSWMQTTTW